METWYFDGFDIRMTLEQARSVSDLGSCDVSVAALLADPAIARQLANVAADDIHEELREYSAWDDEELADTEANKARILWIAAGNIADSSTDNLELNAANLELNAANLEPLRDMAMSIYHGVNVTSDMAWDLTAYASDIIALIDAHNATRVSAAAPSAEHIADGLLCDLSDFAPFTARSAGTMAQSLTDGGRHDACESAPVWTGEPIPSGSVIVSPSDKFTGLDSDGNACTFFDAVVGALEFSEIHALLCVAP